MAPVKLKKNYSCRPSLRQFYDGGPYAVSSDASFLVCACGDKINLVDAAEASIKRSIDGADESYTALALSPDDTRLFSAGRSRVLRVWDLSSLQCVRSWKAHDGPVKGMACDPSGALLATAGADKKVLVWDVDGGFCTHSFSGHKAVVTSILFHPDPNRLLLFSGSDDSTVRVWNLYSESTSKNKGKKCLAVLEKHFSTISSLAVSEDGWTLLSAGHDKVVNLWDLRNYSFKMTIPTYEVLKSVCVISKDSNFVSCIPSHLLKENMKDTGALPLLFFTVGERGIVRAWSSTCASCIYEQSFSDSTGDSDKDDGRRGFISAGVLPFNQGLLCVTADQQFLFHRPVQSSDGKFQLQLWRRLVGYNEEIVDLKFLGDQEEFLAVATNLEQVQVYDLASMSCSYVLSGHTDIVLCLDTCVWKSGRTLIVTGSKDKSVRLWDDQSRSCIAVGTGHMAAVGTVAFAKKQRNFFVTGSSDGTLMVWGLDNLPDHLNTKINLKSKAVVAAHGKRDSKHGKGDINSVAISPDDAFVCSGSQDRTACIWSLPNLIKVATLEGHKRGIWSVEFSPVDKCVITSSGDGKVKIWEISSGACLRTFEGHASSVLRVSFLTRGTQFVSCGADGQVRLWNVKSSECVATYDQHEGKVWALAVGQRTEMLATGGDDAVVNLWFDSTADDEQEAFKKRAEEEERGVSLDLAATSDDYTKAIQLAFQLRRPAKLYTLLAELCRKGDAEVQIDQALRSLGTENIHLLLEYIREWNTKPKFCHVAQILLFRFFTIFSPNEIIEMKGFSELLEGIEPYSQRHLSRINRLETGTYLWDYTLGGLSVDSCQSIHPIQTEDSVITEESGDEEEKDNDAVSKKQQVFVAVSENQEGSVTVAENKVLKKRKSRKLRAGSSKKCKASG